MVRDRSLTLLLSKMTVKDLEKVQTNLSETGQDYQLELEDRKIIA